MTPRCPGVMTRHDPGAPTARYQLNGTYGRQVALCAPCRDALAALGVQLDRIDADQAHRARRLDTGWRWRARLVAPGPDEDRRP